MAVSVNYGLRDVCSASTSHIASSHSWARSLYVYSLRHINQKVLSVEGDNGAEGSALSAVA